MPNHNPSSFTHDPSVAPFLDPSFKPIIPPSFAPIIPPSFAPIVPPSFVPISDPTFDPSVEPTFIPTEVSIAPSSLKPSVESESGSSSSSLSFHHLTNGTIAGIVIGTILGFIILSFIIYYSVRNAVWSKMSGDKRQATRVKNPLHQPLTNEDYTHL